MQALLLWLAAASLFTIHFYMVVEVVAVSSSTLWTRKVAGPLNGAHLKFVVGHVPPLNVLTLQPDGNYTHTGMTAKFLDLLAEKLNFTFSYHFIPIEMPKRKHENHTNEGVYLLYLLSSKEVDGSAIGLIPTPERKKIMDFAYFVSSEPHAILVPRPGEEPRLFAFIRPFQKSVWSLIFITLLAVMLLMSLFSVLYSKISPYNNNLQHHSALNNMSNPASREETFWQTISVYSTYVINIVTNQGGSVPGDRFSFRILVGAWLLAAMVLVNSYAGTIVSYLAVTKMIPPINTMQDLATSEDVAMILFDISVIGQQILNAKSGTSKFLGDQTRRNPDRIMSNMWKISDRLQTGRYAFPFLQSFCNDFVGKTFKKEGNCRFKTTDPITMYGYWYMALQKDSKFTPEFYNAQMEIWETGLPNNWAKNSIQQAPKCFTKKTAAGAARKISIKLNDLLGVFLILGVGVALATLTFLMENIIRYQRNYRSTQSIQSTQIDSMNN